MTDGFFTAGLLGPGWVLTVGIDCGAGGWAGRGGGRTPVQALVDSRSTSASLGLSQMQKLRLAVPCEMWEP